MATAARTRWPHRVWCGAFPLFELPSAAAASDDAQLSELFFGSPAFATLRTTLRLKLQETPPITQQRRLLASHFSDMIELAEQYRLHVVALLRYVDATASATTFRLLPPGTASEAAIGSAYAPLFIGFGAIDLRSEKLVGKDRRLAVALPVDVVLVFVLLGQLYALHAEALVEQGLRLQSEAIVAAAEDLWRSSTLQLTRAVSLAAATSAQWAARDPQLATVIKFLSGVATQSAVLARMAQMQRASARIHCLNLEDETIERLARNTAVCARYAYTVAAETKLVAAALDDSALSRQLAWLVASYTIRWRATVYGYEQTVFQLDYQPELAIYFNELIQRSEKLPALPEYAHRHDAYFTRIAHDIQHAHTAQQSESLEEKAVLVALCQRKFGTLWAPQRLPLEVHEALATIPPLDELFSDGDEAPASDPSIATAWLDEDPPLTLEAIDANVQRARRIAGLETLSISAYSTKAVAALDEPTHSQPVSASVQRRESAPPSPLRSETVPMGRPTSAGSAHSAAVRKPALTTTTEWVTMRVGDKVLHFEPLPSPAGASSSTRPPRPSTAGAAVGHRRNAVPMVIDDFTNDEAQSSAKPRPSSSSSYLTGKKKKKLTDGSGGGALTWVPTRASCALCERRFTRANLPGVVVMKRVFDLRRKWGMVLQDSKKFSAASALYGRASVCVMCQDILTYEDDKEAALHDNNGASREPPPLDDVGALILGRVRLDWLQRPAHSDELVLDVAVNKRARQSSTNFGLSATNAVLAGSLRTAHTKEEFQPWWEVDLGNYYVVHSVKVWLREDTSHVLSVSGAAGAAAATTGHDRKMGVDVPLSAVGFLQSGAGLGFAPAPQPNVGLYPLHLCVSMKTGTDRDLDDILASAVSRHCVRDKVVQPITWLAPANCRGRFVRLQAEAVAFLHIEKVHVFVAHELPTHTAKTRREHARSTLKRAAFRASVISKKSIHAGDATSEQDAALAALAFASKVQPLAAASGADTLGKVARPKGASQADAEQTEKRRISRLYLKFKSLLDARSTYAPADERHSVSFAEIQ